MPDLRAIKNVQPDFFLGWLTKKLANIADYMNHNVGMGMKVGQTQFVRWQDWGDFLKKPQLIRANRCFPHMVMV